MDTMRSTDVTFLGELLFPAPNYRQSALSTISWWEARRGTYNLIVGGTGLFTLAVVRLITWLPPAMHFGFDWRPVAAYGLAANVCYSFGWGIEVALKRIMRDRAPMIGPALFRQGIAFSVGLTLLPILLVSAAWVVRAGLWFFGGRAL